MTAFSLSFSAGGRKTILYTSSVFEHDAIRLEGRERSREIRALQIGFQLRRVFLRRSWHCNADTMASSGEHSLARWQQKRWIRLATLFSSF